MPLSPPNKRQRKNNISGVPTSNVLCWRKKMARFCKLKLFDIANTPQLFLPGGNFFLCWEWRRKRKRIGNFENKVAFSWEICVHFLRKFDKDYKSNCKSHDVIFQNKRLKKECTSVQPVSTYHNYFSLLQQCIFVFQPKLCHNISAKSSANSIFSNFSTCRVARAFWECLHRDFLIGSKAQPAILIL